MSGLSLYSCRQAIGAMPLPSSSFSTAVTRLCVPVKLQTTEGLAFSSAVKPHASKALQLSCHMLRCCCFACGYLGNYACWMWKKLPTINPSLMNRRRSLQAKFPQIFWPSQLHMSAAHLKKKGVVLPHAICAERDDGCLSKTRPQCKCATQRKRHTFRWLCVGMDFKCKCTLKDNTLNGSI